MNKTKGKSIFTKTKAEEIIRLIKLKLKANSTEQKSIRNKIRKIGFYASDFGLRNGYTVADFIRATKTTSVSKIPLGPSINTNSGVVTKAISSSTRDEHYIIDLCDKVLKCKSTRQKRFDFLRGDSGSKLPVDAFYLSLNLAIEYREKQHTEAVALFDKRVTVSGITRGEQRKKYDELRRVVLPQHGIKLIEFDYSEFKHNSQKRLLRDKASDLKIIESKLKIYVQ